MRIAALVLAAGSSQRFGGQPKQFEDLGGVTVLQCAVRPFVAHPQIAEVWVVSSAANHDRTREVLADENVDGVIEGGILRSDSTLLGLAALGSETTHVLVHDAARPLVPTRVIDDCVGALAEVDVVATVVDPPDSILILSDSGIETPSRDSVRLHQTPQGFRRALLTDALDRADAGDVPTDDVPTDDVTAVLRAFPQTPVRLVAGDRRALKITEADDLIAVRAFLAAGA